MLRTSESTAFVKSSRDSRFIVEPGLFRVFAAASSVGGLEASFEVVPK